MSHTIYENGYKNTLDQEESQSTSNNNDIGEEKPKPKNEPNKAFESQGVQEAYGEARKKQKRKHNRHRDR